MTESMMINPTSPFCAVCHENDGVTLFTKGNGHVCELCLKRANGGRDRSTKAARALKFSKTSQASANFYQKIGDEKTAAVHQASAEHSLQKAEDLFTPPAGVRKALGEAVPPKRPGIANLLETPDQVALDASAHRIDLLLRLGTDCTALALDAGNSIRAENSLEKMLAHQLALAHKVVFEVTDRAQFEPNAVEKARFLNLAARLMETFQKGLLTLQRIRSGGEQNITVQHLHVTQGGQAIVGNLKGRGGG